MNIIPEVSEPSEAERQLWKPFALAFEIIAEQRAKDARHEPVQGPADDPDTLQRLAAAFRDEKATPLKKADVSRWRDCATKLAAALRSYSPEIRAVTTGAAMDAALKEFDELNK